MDDFTGVRCPLRPTPGWCFGTERTHGLFSDVGILGILQNQGSNCWGGYESYPPIILKYLNRAFKMHSSTWKTSFNEKKPRLSFGVLNVNPLWPAPGWCIPVLGHHPRCRQVPGALDLGLSSIRSCRCSWAPGRSTGGLGFLGTKYKINPWKTNIAMVSSRFNHVFFWYQTQVQLMDVDG